MPLLADDLRVLRPSWRRPPSPRSSRGFRNVPPPSRERDVVVTPGNPIRFELSQLLTLSAK